MKYTLEVYDSPDATEPLEHFKSDEPFAGMVVGALINDQFMREDGAPGQPFLRVVRVVHVLASNKKTGGMAHHMNVYCSREVE